MMPSSVLSFMFNSTEHKKDNNLDDEQKPALCKYKQERRKSADNLRRLISDIVVPFRG